ncbi:bifunctional tetrahydrofolate synthase/dihydrofolate synthase [Chitinilyticum piscinae]|uniref:Dihydrofolate synthase/folylpolyglutamate synthase n=1 Tax=Chitinilyticum piscinae TaxID=2866724 RepID=A0A8J7FRM1_9NEIS|nr:bifunctional tetrahydrofolate synthase/dihydrofolate synthase [Chitinilyticum piscinae]MBE9609621.1 bifunctional tetrahydrofolate synthase/dihydrofolate synthase [Chitinilyticum piscinae]
MQACDSLDDWLAYLEGLHPKAIDMGLQRVATVRDRLQLVPSCPVIVVGGTNGKGSVCAMLSAMLVAAGYKVGTYTSPHLLHYNERITVDLHPVADEKITSAFAAIEAARGDISLTYFEFGTLAAVSVFMAAAVDVMVLEVGLGGRLDAVNAFDADVAAVVSIGLDHQAYLGDTREAVAQEKAGIYRTARPAFCADPEPPQTLLAAAEQTGCDFRLIGRDYGFARNGEGQQWSWWGRDGARKHALPIPALRGAYQLGNAALAIALLDALSDRLHVPLAAIKRGLLEVEWPARCQVLPGRPVTVLDVAHNPHAAHVLKEALSQMGFYPQTHAVLGMMQDKDIAGVLDELAGLIDVWHLAAPQLPRAATAELLQQQVQQRSPQARCHVHDSVAAAYQAACEQAAEADRILVFGSFYTVAEVLAAREA